MKNIALETKLRSERVIGLVFGVLATAMFFAAFEKFQWPDWSAAVLMAAVLIGGFGWALLPEWLPRWPRTLTKQWNELDRGLD